MSSYGFVHLPSLLVFIRPQPSMLKDSARDVVDIITAAGGDFDDVAPRLSGMDESGRREAVLRLTSLGHEVRHFHDFFLTPYGNQLVRDSFWYSILTFAALTELTGSRTGSETLDVDLPVDTAMLPHYGNRLIAMRRAFNDRMKRGLSVMEADAILVQRYQASIDLGEHAGVVVTDALEHMPKQYSAATATLLRLQRQLTISDRNFAPIGHSLILMCLLDPAPTPIDDLVGAVSKSASGLFGDEAAVNILGAILPTIQGVVRRAMEAAQSENEKFLATIRTAVPEPLRELTLPAFEDFARAAVEVQDDFLRDPMRWMDPEIYLRDCVAESVFPFIYLLAEGMTTMQVKHRRWEELLSDPLTYVEEFSVSGKTLYRLVCIPAAITSGRTLDSQAWKDFADAVAGSLVIAEGANREHPVEGMWMRKTEQNWPVKFTPFGNAGAWRGVAPSGIVV